LISYVAAAVAGYLLGSIPAALIVARRHGVDLRTVGDGNPGAWNALDQLGPRRAWPAFAGDGLKGTLAALAGLAIGLAISSAATTPDRAISIVPLALIPQILFAGVIFTLGDGYTVERLLSWFTVSRWAMDAYGTTVNLNEMNFQPGLLRVVKDEYAFTAGHLLSRWAILLVYMAVCLGITAWQLHSRDRQV